MNRGEALEVMALLEERFPDARSELDFTNPFELLIATILSAQTTDVQVNKVTERLFACYPTAKALSEATVEEVEPFLRSIGLFRNKSKNILATAKILVKEYGGSVPDTLEELIKLPGVGRKTANVVLSNAFDTPAIAVDTHVFRVSNRIGLSHSKDVASCEKDLSTILPSSLWAKGHHLLIFLGRRICKARTPLCSICPVSAYCEYFNVIE